MNFHLLTVFRMDAAECQKVYISNTLKKLQRVPVRYFFLRVEQLNGHQRFSYRSYGAYKRYILSIILLV